MAFISLCFAFEADQQSMTSAVGFIAFDGDITSSQDYTITFARVESNSGNHFNRITGEFTAPVDGLYIASLTVVQKRCCPVAACIGHKSGQDTVNLGSVETKDLFEEASRTMLVSMKAGDILYSFTWFQEIDFNCKHFSCFLLGS